jgi:hypothetical protein
VNKKDTDPNEITPLLYSFQDTARMLGCSTFSVGRLVAKGKLRAVGNGRAKRVLAESVAAYVNPRDAADKVVS